MDIITDAGASIHTYERKIDQDRTFNRTNSLSDRSSTRSSTRSSDRSQENTQAYINELLSAIEQRDLRIAEVEQQQKSAALHIESQAEFISTLTAENISLRESSAAPDEEAPRSTIHQKIHAHILQEHAFQLWFSLNNRLSFQRGGNTYSLIGGNLAIRKAVPIEGETLTLSESEVEYLRQHSYDLLMEHYADMRAIEEDHQQPTETDVQQLLPDQAYLRERIEQYREREARTRRLLANKDISAAHKLILMHIEDEVSQQRPELTDLIRIDMSAVGSATGLSRYTVGDKVRDLAAWGALEKTTEKVKMEKKGKKIEVDLVSVALNRTALIAPEDIRPVKDGEEYSRNHGGRRERCRRCNSQNIQRLHHIRCLDCGDEYICSDDLTQDVLQLAPSMRQVAPRTIEAQIIHEASCPSDHEISVSQLAPHIVEAQTIRESTCPTHRQPCVRQVAPRTIEAQTSSPSFSPEEELSEAGADFWTRWRALTGESHLNENACKHIEELAQQITSTQNLQSLYDFAYSRLEEFAKSQGKKAVPPRLGNLVKCLPEWRQTQKRRDQEQAPQQAPDHLPGTGHLTNWTELRQRGEALPVTYTRLRPARTTKSKRAADGLSKITLNDLGLKRRDGKPT